jgi:hypothetical protein
MVDTPFTTTFMFWTFHVAGTLLKLWHDISAWVWQSDLASVRPTAGPIPRQKSVRITRAVTSMTTAATTR